MWALFQARRWGRWREQALGLPRVPQLVARASNGRLVHACATPLLYGISPQVLPRPAYWPRSVHVCGFWQPKQQLHQRGSSPAVSAGAGARPDAGATDPVDTGSMPDAPIVIALGSMAKLGLLPRPMSLLQVLAGALCGIRRRAILLTSTLSHRSGCLLYRMHSSQPTQHTAHDLQVAARIFTPPTLRSVAHVTTVPSDNARVTMQLHQPQQVHLALPVRGQPVQVQHYSNGGHGRSGCSLPSAAMVTKKKVQVWMSGCFATMSRYECPRHPPRTTARTRNSQARKGVVATGALWLAAATVCLHFAPWRVWHLCSSSSQWYSTGEVACGSAISISSSPRTTHSRNTHACALPGLLAGGGPLPV